jgi:hypothetical protein
VVTWCLLLAAGGVASGWPKGADLGGRLALHR